MVARGLGRRAAGAALSAQPAAGAVDGGLGTLAVLLPLILAWLLFGEPFGLTTAVGMACVAVGWRWREILNGPAWSHPRLEPVP
jgi:drug/metabolite transporter (DMT)-like permease